MFRGLLVLIGIVLFASSAGAWTAKTYQVIVVKSVRLMPVSFQGIMLRHQEEILTGCLRPDEMGEKGHAYDVQARSGYIQDQILELSKTIPKMIHDHKPFKHVAIELGKMAHYMSDLNDPLLLADEDARENQYRSDFAVFTEKNMEKFPWIFHGHEDPLLTENQMQAYLHKVAQRAAKQYPLLGESYFPNGTLVSSDTFDLKSLPFGIASLSFSNSISDTVQVWFHTWKKAHGDITNTPLYKKTKENRQ
ncbi:MAG TPA: hypothetical protein VJ521_01115 [Acidobacteriota bacterium]|nr:hypothetical protein [Acidobacteriota bacterium]